MDDVLKAQAGQLVDALAKAMQTDGLLRQIRLVPIAKAKLLWFIEGAAAGYMMCEDCDGQQVVGYYPATTDTPPEPIRCDSCGGSGRWKLPEAPS